jgi:hypothetical protein
MRGVLCSWHVNGYGMVAVGEQLYFLHRKNITQGEWIRPSIGSVVEFEIAAPYGKGKFDQAINAVVKAAENESHN